ncbi:rho guanine nucleotide exchange factor 33 [Hippocampus zosterae]|uniref:rho guanine nucleotide exchange factor 33 n=1 Tax=Hippocampus zosterae TaxID=109293 RepID=UPI00223D0526|nr:rho guanine nucleotide exchange factor 33 [Hippocampus zosterae]
MLLHQGQDVMKPQEAELVTEISKLQWMVSELKTGLTGALVELAHIQHGDSALHNELEDNQRRCREKARRLEALVESLREELVVIRCQVFALRSHTHRRQQDAETTAAARGEIDPAEVCRGKVLLHCFLQGLKAGLTDGTDARHQVALQLLHSEWEYVSILKQLYDQYKTTPTQHTTTEPHEKFASLVERLLQRHLLFRDTLQERLAAQRWKSLVGDVLVGLVGQNDTSFSDAYVGYVGALATFLLLEVHKSDKRENKQESGHTEKEKEQIQVLSLLLAPVTRVHAYLSHIQNLLQWTGKEHPDCSLLLGTERALRDILLRCHTILEEDVHWDGAEAPKRRGCGDVEAGGSCPNSAPQRTKVEHAAPRESQEVSGLTNRSGVDQHAMRVECWSCSPVRRQTCRCANAQSSCPVIPEPPDYRVENDDSDWCAATRRGDPGPEEPRTDLDDTSAFDDSSVTSCREGEDEEDEEEEDSHVPVLLKPSSQQYSKRSVCLRWQIPRRTPHPPIRTPANPSTPAGSCGKRLVTVRTGSPPLRVKSAFRPIWDNPTKQAHASPEKEHRGFVPVQTSVRANFLTLREHPRVGQDLVQPPPSGLSVAPPNGRLWEDSEESEGPCSTV